MVLNQAWKTHLTTLLSKLGVKYQSWNSYETLSVYKSIALKNLILFLYHMLLDSIGYECEAEFYHLSSSDLFFTQRRLSLADPGGPSSQCTPDEDTQPAEL